MGLFSGKQNGLLESVTAFLREDDWKFSMLDGKPGVRFGVTLKNAAYTCIGVVDEEKRQFRFFVSSSTNVPQARRAVACEYLTRANYGLRFGCFEMDMSDGEVRFRDSISVEDSNLSKAMIRSTIYTCAATMDRYYAGLMSILYSNTAPGDALAVAEAA
jgi:hypothetical protein